MKDSGGAHDSSIGNNYCGDPALLEPVDNCSMIFKAEEITKKFKEACVGKKNCTFNMKEESFLNYNAEGASE